jgi:CxxC motif-containing protein (DUF1111 family)
VQKSVAGFQPAYRRRRIARIAASVVGWLVVGAISAHAAQTDERFGAPRNGLARDELSRFERGKALFDSRVKPEPAAGSALSGLGPVYNLEGCGGCHIRDGRGRPPLLQGEPLRQMVLRLSVRNSTDGTLTPHPAYGDQLNNQAVKGVPAEGEAFVESRAVKGRYGDGTPFELAAPHYGFLGMAFGRLDDRVLVSARVPPPVAGAGLLEAVPETAILALADADDADGDGISGRPNRVPDLATGQERLGRFGWKANQPSVKQQIANAARTDMGITSARYPREDCPPVQRACREAGSQGRPELDEATLDALEAYLRQLDPAPRRGAEREEVRTGEDVFADFGCTRCHVPALPIEAGSLQGLAPATIAAYTDLLLHDMGEGLADGRPDGLAGGTEWRTAPLWGIGRTESINGHTRFLHDGRARGVGEAILWHGGEAAPAKERFRTAPADQRAALIAFLNSL